MEVRKNKQTYKSGVMSYDLITFTQHGPSMKLAGNSLALTTAGTEPAGMKQSE